MPPTILIIPGLHNSGPDHWQSHFERELENCIRIEQTEWKKPVCNDWITNLDNAVQKYGTQVVLAAHSMGCATVAHWAAKYQRLIAGALLVGPSDVEAPTYPFETTGFVPIPLSKLPFRTIVVASRNDRFVSFERAQYFAHCWGAELEDAGDAGHLNTDAGYGPWPRGKELLRKLTRATAQRKSFDHAASSD
jgi:predicted alpha/beta hydrolase family esterase